MALTLLALASLLCASCGATREAKYADAAASDLPPTNFTLAITVQSPAVRGGQPRSAQPARYILEPDGLLRAAATRAATEEFYPAQTRRLSDDDQRRVWLALRDGPLFRADHPAIVPLPPSSDSSSPPAKTTYTITYIAGDVRQILLLSDGRPGSDDLGAAAKLTDQLADLAWIK